MKIGTRHILTSLTPIVAMGVAAVVVVVQMLNFQQKKLEETLRHDADLVTMRLEDYVQKVEQVTDSLAHRNLSLESTVARIQASAEIDFFNAYVADAPLKTMLVDLNHLALYRSWDPLSPKDIIPVDQQGVFSGRIIHLLGAPNFARTSNVYTEENIVIGRLFVSFVANEKFLQSLLILNQDSLQFGVGIDVLGTIGTLDPSLLTVRVTSKKMPNLWVEIRRDVSSIQGRGRLTTGILFLLMVAVAGSAFIFQWRATNREIIQPLKNIHSIIIDGSALGSIGKLPDNEIGTIGIAIINQKFDLEQKVLVIRSITEQLQKESSMIKVLSHDIATPLTVIKAVTQMLKKKVSAEDAVSQELIRRLGIQTKSVEQILGHVRDMKALESGKRRLDLHEIEFGVVLNEIHEAFQDRLADKGLTLSWNKADDSVTFVADAVSFRVSVLSNLISNAIKFSARGGRIDISCREVNGLTTIQVRDYGAGIPLSIRANLFSSNHATTRAGSEGESGTGFGMPLVKFYIDLYGGKIDFSTKLESDSATDHGTTFIIQLPTKLRPASQAAA